MDVPRNVYRRIRWGAGLAAAAVLVWMSYLSMQDGYSLQFPVIAGMLAVIVLLMYGVDELENVIESWRGTGRQDRDTNDNGGESDD